MACVNPNDPTYKEILARIDNPILAEIEFDRIDNLQSTVENQLIVEQDDDLITKGGQSYVYLNEDDAKRFNYLLEKHKEFPKEFSVTKKITRYERDPKNPLKFNGYNEYVDFYYIKLNTNKKSNLYKIVSKQTGEVIAEKVRVLRLSQDSKSKIAEQYGVEFKPTKVFSANRSIAFSLYRQKPSKAKYVAQAKKYLYDAIKFLNPEESNLIINLDKIEQLLDSFPEEMWDYINTTYSPENSTNINASISLQNEIKFNLPKLGLVKEIEKNIGIPLIGVSFRNYDGTGKIEKLFKYSDDQKGWGATITIDPAKLTSKQLIGAISYYLKSIDFFKPSTEQENVRKYAEHNNIDSKELEELVFGDIEKALDNVSYNNTGNSDTIEVSKWRESIRNYNWQSAELLHKPYQDFQNTVKERITEKFKDKKLSNGISHLSYFFNSGAFNWLNINFNNISGTYYQSDMETEAGVGVQTKMGGIINPFEIKMYQKPKAGENFLEEKEVFNRLGAILHEPFHALHALSYGTKEERELKKAFDNLYNTSFGKEMMDQVFGSGYNNGQNISYDTLYKEFTAFTTQLMLYPKEWINKTDLRSNDIAEFILKIQSLQDKTYQEILETQEKIGTTERTITQEEKIKLSFLQKLYNYIVKALNDIIPLSKKFLQSLPESNIVSKQVIEDVFGTIEEDVTKTIKLPENIKKSKEEFLQKMDELQAAINTLMQIDTQSFSSSNLTNFFINDQGSENEFEEPLYQLSDSKTISSKASAKTIATVKDFLTRIGVNFESVKEIVVNGKKIDANGVARITQALVQVIEGNDATALPEEAMHFAVEIIQQTDTKLFNQLLKEINSYNIYKQVLDEYSGNSFYQTKDGKPDILKLKKEAIGKVLAETIIKQHQGFTEKPELLAKTQTLWQKILQAISNLFTKSGFDRFAMDILSGKEIGTVNELVKSQSEDIYLQQDPQQRVIDDLKAVSAKIKKIDEVYYIDGNKINRRVTELVDDWYRRRYGDNTLTKSEFQTAVDDLKAEKGTAGHNDIEHAATLYVNNDGSLKTKDEMDAAEVADTHQSLINPNNQDMYIMLRDNLRQRLESFPSGTKFLFEQKIYDPNRNIAGAVDFLAITPEGKVSILDWKFMNLNTELYTDVPWYKVLAWQIQMNQYKLILQNAYGVKAQDFEQTRMIPIQAIYSEQNAKTGELPRLLNIKIGDVNVKNIKEDFLLPVALKDEKTGKRKIDQLIERLNALYENISNKPVVDEEKLAKNEQLNKLFSAIRHLQMQEDAIPLINQGKILIVYIKSIIDKYEQKYKGRDPKTFNNDDINDFSGEIQDSLDAIEVYTKLYSNLKDIIQDDEGSDVILEDLRKVSDDAIDLKSELEHILNEFTSEITAKKENVSNLLLPEKVIKGVTRLFSTTSKLQTKAIQFIYKKANKAFGYSAQDALTENKRLIDLKTKYDAWAKSKGLSFKNYFSLIKKKDSNELIDQYSPEFYTLLKEKTKNKDYEWVRESVDIPAYNAHLKEKLKTEVERIVNKPRILTQDEQDGLEQYLSSGNEVTLPKEIQLEIYNARALYNTSTTTSPGWLITKELAKFPNKDKWTTSEWTELNKPENAPVKEFYDYIIEKNNEYANLNYISKGAANTFLPFVRKSLAEKFVIGGNFRLGEQFFRAISVDEGDTGYGEIDKLTGKPINKIPKYFTRDIDGETSEDLFRVMAFYNESAIRYKYLKQIENQISAVLAVERNKQSIATSLFGKSRIEDGELKYNDENVENSKLADAMMRAIIYNQRYLESDTFDQLLGKLGTWGKTFNSKLGVNIFPENISERQVSINKVIDQLNNTFQLTTLGLNLLSASSNFFGGNAQSIINAGIYFTKTDYLAAEGMIFMDKFSTQDQKKMIGALEYFLPLTENYNREIAKSLSLNKLSQENIQDFLMILMRKTDLNVQTANFYAYLKNSVVIDGRVENAREYLRAQPKYVDKYKVSAEERKTLEEQFEKDVKELIDEKGVLTLGKVENDEFVIPGVDRKDDSVLELRRKVQQLSKDALGNLSEDDLRTINMTVYGKSFMIFKNWIPRLAEVRLGNLQYDSASDAYEWGRVRTVFSIISKDVLGSIGNLRNSLVANDKGVEFLRELYEKKAQEHKQETGEDLNMTEAQFIDLVRKNVRNQMYDVIFYITLFILVAGIKGLPDDEEDPVIKNQYKFITKAADKFKDEIAYFYDPTSISSLFSKGLFPSLSLVDNFTKLFKNFMIENWAIATDNEELAEKTQVIKYLMKSFPISNQMVGYLPMFYPELAKDMGIKMQKNYGIR